MSREHRIRTIAEILAARPDSGGVERLTESGLGIAFSQLYRDVVRYAVDTGRWYVWDGTRWRPDTGDNTYVFGLTMNLIEERRFALAAVDDAEARETGLRELARLETARHRQQILVAAAAETIIQVTQDQLDADPFAIVCANGTVDLRDGSLRPSLPDDLNTLRSPVVYDPEATSEHLELFLKTFIPEPEDQRFIFAELGHALLAGNVSRHFILIRGGTTSGKSQLVQMINTVMGDYACVINASVFRSNLDDRPRPDLVHAMFRRLAWASEASRSWTLHADQIKRITGGEPLPYRNLYAGMQSETPRFTPMIMTNVLPRISGVDPAVSRRVIIIPMDRSLRTDQEDITIKQAFLADEQTQRAVLARLVAGARDDIVRTPPAKFLLAKMNTGAELSHLDEFITWARDDNEYVVQLAADTPTYRFIRVNHMYGLYRHWLMTYGDADDRKDLMSLREFNRSCADMFGWTKVRSAAVRWAELGLAPVLPVEIRIALGGGIDAPEA